ASELFDQTNVLALGDEIGWRRAEMRPGVLCRSGLAGDVVWRSVQHITGAKVNADHHPVAHVPHDVTELAHARRQCTCGGARSIRTAPKDRLVHKLLLVTKASDPATLHEGSFWFSNRRISRDQA